jgi:hypothetical protein
MAAENFYDNVITGDGEGLISLELTPEYGEYPWLSVNDGANAVGTQLTVLEIDGLIALLQAVRPLAAALQNREDGGQL